jgi:chromosomal replication initiation ATPase DnaA
MYLKNNPNNPIHLFLIGGVGIGKTFVLRLINQELKQLYNKDLSLILTKQKLYSWHL